MKNKKLSYKISLLVFVLSLILANVIFTNPNPQKKLEIPNTSAGEINIITPENKTYFRPMTGYYPAVYGFEDEFEGTTGTTINFVDNTTYPTCEIVSEIDGHKKVLQLSQTTNWAQVTNNVSNIVSGTIEWYARVPVGYASHRLLMLEDSTISVDIYFHDDGMIYEHDGTEAPFTTYVANTWTHIRIDFECGSGGYEGLAADTFYVYIDGEKFGPFNFMSAALDIDQMFFDSGDDFSTRYIDAIGYSWDLDYNIGDNLNEGLLLSFENNTTTDWLAYSLDNQMNKTISGNTSIIMPDPGLHKIQMFGNNSFGTMYESPIRYFSVSPINLITPENKTYFGPMTGYYPAVYGFEDEFEGTTGTTINFVDNTTYPTCEIVSEIDGHKKVLQLSQTTNWAQVTNNVSNIVSGTIEWYARVPVGYASHRLLMLEDSTISVDIYFHDDGMIYEHDGTEAPFTTYVANTWTHIRIDFECGSGGYEGLAADTFYVYIDGEKFGPFNFMSAALDIDQMFFDSGDDFSTRYIDAIGYSWDLDYNIGDNLNEGLLLSYENSITTDWMGYSLDGQSNKTIIGNSTIPMPSDGTHNVQIFSNDSIGNMYNSSIRYFTTNAFSPTININSPTLNDLYGNSAPDFNIEIPDQDLHSTWYSLDGGTTNILFSGLSGTIAQSEWNKYLNGTVTIGFYANDSANHIGQASVVVRKDVLGPNITVNSPQDDDIFGFYAPNYDLSIEEFNLDSIWYSFDYGTTVLPISSHTGTLDQTVWETFGSGTVPIRFYANDSLGHESFTDVLVVKDLTIPIITIISPSAGEVLGHTPPDYNITITETELESYWYTLDGGTTNITISNLNGTIDQLEWDKLGNGTVIITFYAKDEGDNIGFAEITVFKDINLPLITINSPGTLDIFGVNPPEFDLSIVEPNLDSMWYTLDGGVTNTSFTGVVGTINSVEWAKFGDLVITIKFYARDEAGNIAFAEVQVDKDITAPVVTVNEPINAEEFENPPIFDISVVEDNLEEMWYTLNGGITNITIYSTDGIISQSAWNSAPDGALTIRFYARDSGGNEAYDDVHIVKYSPESPPPGIPGYNTIFLIGIVIIVSVLFSRKQLHK